MTLLEICVDTADGLAAAVEGGADRIELCSALSVGGLTPPASLIALAAAAPVPVAAMVRPRDGDFRYSAGELAQMRADIAATRDAGLAGVVIGANHADGSLDTDALAGLIEAAGPLETVLHRAFDLTPDPAAALEQAIALGFTRVLTSGTAPTVVEGAELIAALVAQASGRITIMAGGGLTPENAAALVRRTGVREVHASAGAPLRDYPPSVIRFGFAGQATLCATDAAIVRALKAALAEVP